MKAESKSNYFNFIYFFSKNYDFPLAKSIDPHRQINLTLRIQLVLSEAAFWIGFMFLIILIVLLVKFTWEFAEIILNPIFITLLITTLLCFSISIKNAFEKWIYFKHGIIAKARIKFIETISFTGPDGDSSHDYNLEFETPEKDIVITKIRIASTLNHYKYKNNKQLLVVYLPWDPQKAVPLESLPQAFIAKIK